MKNADQVDALLRAIDWQRAALSCVRKCIKEGGIIPDDHAEYILERIRRANNNLEDAGYDAPGPLEIW
ncbi:MAG: hypothetical protein E6Q97_14520 [Desulfurellales bacterium]|nr:MAG: hypothetical protein E6Q97_14520 [Desulfurellales bacterium]